MHQTFYIDADEEISSVIDKLNKSVSAENYFVVPKRAIFLQSIVNLKLLKRESDKLGKHLVVVTQDEIGASMAQRSGLEVKHTIEGLESSEIEEIFHVDESGKELDFFDAEAVIDEEVIDKRSRLNAVGSSDFFDATEKNHETLPKVIKSQVKKVPISGVSTAEKKHNLLTSKASHHQMSSKAEIHKHSRNTSKSLYGGKIDPGKEKILEKMFSVKNNSRENFQQELVGVNPVTKKIFVGFVIACFFVFAGIATYLFLPSAKIVIIPNVVIDKSDLIILGNSDITQPSQKNLHIRVIEKEKEFSMTHAVAGGGQGVGKKAHGTVVIYNEFSNSPQTLIATTRLESTDGKIFRLVKNVVVPGTTTVGNETKSGAIEVEVIADQPGSDFNITPTSFTVPGFKESPKYAKFYAKSTENFTGGSSEGGASPGVVGQGDIDSAKQKTEEELKSQISKEISDELAEGEVLLKQAEKILITKAGTTVKVGDMIENFEYRITASARILVFLEKDVKSIIEESIKGQQNLENTNWEVSKLEYGASVVDFDKNTLEMKIHSEISITPLIDSEKIKKELLGKKDDQLESVLRNYSSIKSVNVEFQPTIVSRIPQYGSRVKIEINKEAQ